MLTVLLETPALAHVTALNVTTVEPFAEGAAFGGGGYERVKGTYRGEIDPADARNKVIVNIDKVPRNAATCAERILVRANSDEVRKRFGL
jgi:hypothetical protein